MVSLPRHSSSCLSSDWDSEYTTLTIGLIFGEYYRSPTAHAWFWNWQGLFFWRFASAHICAPSRRPNGALHLIRRTHPMAPPCGRASSAGHYWLLHRAADTLVGAEQRYDWSDGRRALSLFEIRPGAEVRLESGPGGPWRFAAALTPFFNAVATASRTKPPNQSIWSCRSTVLLIPTGSKRGMISSSIT